MYKSSRRGGKRDIYFGSGGTREYSERDDDVSDDDMLDDDVSDDDVSRQASGNQYAKIMGMFVSLFAQSRIFES